MKALFPLVGVVLLVILPGPLLAATAVGVDIQVDGKNAAGTTFTWKGESNAEIWQSLKRRSLTFERDFPIPQDPQDKNKAALRGEIKLTLKAAGESGASATVEQLELEQRDGRWYVTDAEVMRTMAAAGLKLPAGDDGSRSGSAISPPMFMFFVLAAVLAITFILVVLFLTARRRKQLPQ